MRVQWTIEGEEREDLPLSIVLHKGRLFAVVIFQDEPILLEIEASKTYRDLYYGARINATL